jgi:hypothetical protein
MKLTLAVAIASITGLVLGLPVRAETIALNFNIPIADRSAPANIEANVKAIEPSIEPTSPAPIALNFDPPAPVLSTAASPSSPPAIAQPSPAQPPLVALTPLPVPTQPPAVRVAPKPLPPPPPVAQLESAPPPEISAERNPDRTVVSIPENWWQQGSNSPLAIALGTAEGTRRSDGGKNPAYYWHTDPGNGADNFGTFSYQLLLPAEKAPVVAARTVEEKRRVSNDLGLPDVSDRRQLVRLKKFHDRLQQQASEKGIGLNQAELIGGLDLANQAPLAALNSMGYIDRLIEMKKLLRNPDEQIIEARVWSYWHPQRQKWDAPGLGNTYARIRHDQQRRQAAIAQAMAVQNPPNLPIVAPPSSIADSVQKRPDLPSPPPKMDKS